MTDDFTLRFQEKGRGIPVLLIHGFPFSSQMWARQLDSWSDQARSVAPDLPGFGDSPVIHEAFSVEQYAESCLAVLDALDILEPTVIGGLSMGGYVSLAFARLYPERVRALMLFSTRAGADSLEGKANRDKTIAQVREHGAVAVTEAMYPKLLAPATYVEKPAAAAELQDIMRTASPEGIIGALKAMRDRPDSTNYLREISVPTLIIHGRQDAVIPPSEAQAMAEPIANSELHLVDNAGHLLNLEQPDEFSRIVSTFLQSLM
ncbi:MAG: alpha/beta fold hydrolase [Anaerolineales bacterium]